VAVAAFVLAACVLVLPPLLVPSRTDTADGVETVDRLRLENERIGLQNQARATLLQAFAGAFFLVTAFLTWRQIQVNREGQITERFTRAVEHLGEGDKLDVRLGGIYALERIAHDSRSDRGAIVEILTAYVRGHAAGADLRIADLSAADLSGSNLQAADLRGANLERARLVGADLRDAKLAGARLGQADLREAKLTGADLGRADLRRANLRAVELTRSTLSGVDLRDANLGEACLEGARLDGATLRNANLWAAKLSGANLRTADLTRSSLVQAALEHVNLDCAILDGAILTGARLHGTALASVTADRATVWPAGFDWRSAGVTIAGA
jgi:uncharacterized protein YjbI with pentapeptide repeats